MKKITLMLMLSLGLLIGTGCKKEITHQPKQIQLSQNLYKIYFKDSTKEKVLIYYINYDDSTGHKRLSVYTNSNQDSAIIKGRITFVNADTTADYINKHNIFIIKTLN